MHYLIDTHILLRFLLEPTQLSPTCTKLMTDRANHLHISRVSLREIAIKLNIGKLSLDIGFHVFLNEISNNFIQTKEVSNNHLVTYQKLPTFQQHRDPFDRMLIAQAKSENIPIVTHDRHFHLYDIDTIR